VFTDEPEGRRSIEFQLGQRGTGLLQKLTQLGVGHDIPVTGEGGLGAMAKDAIA
jgi:hypothetical protein